MHTHKPCIQRSSKERLHKKLSFLLESFIILCYKENEASKCLKQEDIMSTFVCVKVLTSIMRRFENTSKYASGRNSHSTHFPSSRTTTDSPSLFDLSSACCFPENTWKLIPLVQLHLEMCWYASPVGKNIFRYVFEIITLDRSPKKRQYMTQRRCGSFCRTGLEERFSWTQSGEAAGEIKRELERQLRIITNRIWK